MGRFIELCGEILTLDSRAECAEAARKMWQWGQLSSAVHIGGPEGSRLAMVEFKSKESGRAWEFEEL